MKQFILNLWYAFLYKRNPEDVRIPNTFFWNMPFDKLPNWQQRVVIAQDVINQLNSGVVQACKGTYFSRLSVHDDTLMGADVKSNFKNLKSCKACALGACLISITKFKNKLHFNELQAFSEFLGAGVFRKSNKVKDLLKSIFDPATLAYIEAAFEQTGGCRIYSKESLGAQVEDSKMQMAAWFRPRVEDHNLRLIAIMKNIIDNRGEFKPEL